MRGTIECQHAAIVSPTDNRIWKLREDHPTLTTFISKFSGQFREQVWPSLLLLHTEAPKPYYTAEAVTAFRDIISLSVVPYAPHPDCVSTGRVGWHLQTRFNFIRGCSIKQYEEMILVNPAQTHMHVLSEFTGQSFPEQPQASIMEGDIDFPLARELLNQWVVRFSEGVATWKERALFRSLSMANEAGRIPALTAAVFYDTGRSLALWVSAYGFWLTRAARDNQVSILCLPCLRA